MEILKVGEELMKVLKAIAHGNILKVGGADGNP
jgi:hypothetical protein